MKYERAPRQAFVVAPLARCLDCDDAIGYYDSRWEDRKGRYVCFECGKRREFTPGAHAEAEGWYYWTDG